MRKINIQIITLRRMVALVSRPKPIAENSFPAKDKSIRCGKIMERN